MRSHRFFLPMLFLTGLLFSCGDSDNKTTDTTDPTDTAPPTDTGLPVDTAVDAPVLTSSHTGWLDPCCLSCHVEDSHNSGMAPYQCTTCHGTNGATDGHNGATPCSTCHGEPHSGCSGDFPDPDACQSCHPG